MEAFARSIVARASRRRKPLSDNTSSVPIVSGEQGVDKMVTTVTGTGLKRSLGRIDLLFMGIGATIGAGIFVLIGVAARDSAGPAVMLSFLVASFACFFDALCYAELATRYPTSGSAYLYTYFTFGELASFLVGTNLMIEYAFGAAAVSHTLVSYGLQLLHDCGLGVSEKWTLYHFGNTIFELNWFAPSAIMLITVMLSIGVRESSIFNTMMTTVSILVVFTVICSGATYVEPSNWIPFAPYGFSGIMRGATQVFFSYIGFDAVPNASDEAINPRRDLPFGIIGSLCVCAMLYMGVAAVVTGMVPYQELDVHAPLSAAFDRHGSAWVRILIDVGALFGLTTTLLMGLYSQPRIYFGMSRDGLIPPFLSHASRRFGTPIAAQMTCGLVASVLALTLSIEQLSNFLGIGLQLAYSFVCGGVVVIRAKDRVMSTTLVLLFAFGVAVSTCAYLYIPWMPVPIAFAVITLIPAVLLFFTKYKEETLDFGVPLVPVTPLVGISVNVFLMVHAHYLAWIRLVLVGLVSIVFYLVYSMPRSKAAEEYPVDLLDIRTLEAEGSEVLLSIECNSCN